MSEPKVTIRDVAVAAGVSPATVSRALSQPGRVNLETSTRVRQVAERLGYRTKSLGSEPQDALRGLILTTATSLKYSVFAEFVEGMQQPCLDRSFTLLTAITDSRELERNTIMRMSSQVDGLILTSSRLSDSTIRKAAQVRPTVIINRLVGGVQSVISDDRPALIRTVQRLKALGHRSITYIAGPPNSWQNGLRWQTLLTACQHEGIRIRQFIGPVLDHVDEPDVVYEQFLDNPSTAVVTFNDMLALQFIDFLQRRGIAVPKQVSVVGIDDIDSAQKSNPPLSTIAIPRGELGQVAAVKLLERILHIADAGTTPFSRQSVLVERGSTGPASPDWLLSVD